MEVLYLVNMFKSYLKSALISSGDIFPFWLSPPWPEMQDGIHQQLSEKSWKKTYWLSLPTTVPFVIKLANTHKTPP